MLRQVLYEPRVFHADITDPGIGGQSPADVPYRFGPVDPVHVGVVVEAGCSFCERAYPPPASVKSYRNEAHRLVQAAFKRYYPGSVLCERPVVVVGVELLRRGDHPVRHERPPLPGFFLPDLLETALDNPERGVEVPSRGVLHRLLEVEQARTGDHPSEIFPGEEGVVEEHPGTGNKHVTGAVVVRSIVFLSSVHPLPVVPVVIAVERGHHVAQEGGLPAAAGCGQCGLRHHGVPFKQHGPGEYSRKGACSQLSGEEVQRPEYLDRAELHLGGVPPFVDGQLLLPQHRSRPVSLRNGEHVHPFRRPGYGGVGKGVVGVKDHRHLRRTTLPYQESRRPAVHYPGRFQPPCIYPCQGVHPLGIDNPEILRGKLHPPDLERVVPRRVELGGSKGAGEDYAESRQETFHCLRVLFFAKIAKTIDMIVCRMVFLVNL